MESSFLEVTDELLLPRAELAFRASRSGGPGGQHVNTSSTRIELIWNVAASPSINEAQRTRIQQKLANRINAEGELLLAESGSRSQLRNREAVTARLVVLLQAALRVPQARKKTRPPTASRERRLQDKKHRSELKRLRGPASSD